MRVVAVVDGGLYTGAVARSIDGEVAIRNVRRLRPADLGEVVAADWRSSESIVAITRGAEMLVGQVSVDGLGRASRCSATTSPPPLTAIAAAANRPLLVTDQAGVWSFGGGDQAPGARSSAAPPTPSPSTPADRRPPNAQLALSRCGTRPAEMGTRRHCASPVFRQGESASGRASLAFRQGEFRVPAGLWTTGFG